MPVVRDLICPITESEILDAAQTILYRRLQRQGTAANEEGHSDGI